MRNWFSTLVISSGLLFLTGCSSMMSHSGGKEGLYPGTKASAATLVDDDTSWTIKPLVALDLPFTAVLDTVLLPWDMFRKDSSVRSRVEASEQQNMAINAVIPPAELSH